VQTPKLGIFFPFFHNLAILLFSEIVIFIKRDFLKHKTVKTNDKIRRFGVVMTPLSRKMHQIMQITAFTAVFGAKN